MNEEASSLRRVAPVVAATIAVALTVANVALLVAAHRALSPATTLDDAATVAAPLIYIAIGLLILTRARHPIGWILVATGLTVSAVTFGSLYATAGLRAAPGSLPMPQEIAAVAYELRVVLAASLPLLLVLFPTGRPPAGPWRCVPWALAVGVLITYAGFLLKDIPISITGHVTFANPFGIASAEAIVGPLLVAGAWAVVIASAASFAALVQRFRRGDADLRQQIKWLALVAAVGFGCIVVTMVSLIACGCDSSPIADVAIVALIVDIGLGIPAAIAVALFRYRLYELDLVVSKALVYTLLAAAFTLVYVGIVIGVGAIVGDRGNSLLTPIAAVAIAIGFQPVRRRVRHLANRMVYGRRATPYEVLAEFSERVGGAFAAEEVLPRMAETLAAGTGATVARVWLRSDGELRVAASWPEHLSDRRRIALTGDGPLPFPDDAGVEVRHRGELLGALSVTMPANDPMNPAKDRLLHDLAGQAGLGLRNVRLVEELRASRRRIVTAQDERAKRLERNLHDGAQQQLVALAVQLSLAERLAARDAPAVGEVLARLREQAQDALDNLRDLARGIYPPLLADEGLVVALDAHSRKAAIPVDVEAAGVGRYPQEVEAAVYFCCLEALQNVSKYANASRATIRLRAEADSITFEVVDDGTGFDPVSTPPGSGVQGMRDRLEAVGGTLDVRSAARRGTTVTGTIPAKPRARS